jgi:hypothetical protein
MRSPLNALLTEKALHAVSIRRNAELAEHVLSDSQGDSSALPIKNVCAKVSIQLSDEIDEVVAQLGIPKRRFLEAAFVEAIAMARRIMEEEGVNASLEELAGPVLSSVQVVHAVEA